MVGMLTPYDQLLMRKETEIARIPYREVLAVFPLVTSGSNYEPFTDSPYDTTGALSGQETVAYDVYRMYARIKIVKDTTLLGLNQVYTGLEVGDYLFYFTDTEKPTLDRMVNEKESYLVVDDLQLRPYNTTLNGNGQTFDVFVHGKRFSPTYRKEGT